MSDGYESGERRPIAARAWKFSILTAHWLARNGVSPNVISVAGMISGVLAGICFAATSHLSAFDRLLWFGGAALVQLRLLANMLDGMVAIESHRASPVGELFNEVPDRISDCATLIGLGFASNSNLLLGFVAALTALFTAYVRTVGKAAGAHQDFCGPMAKQQRMFLVTVVALLCAVSPRKWQWIADVSILEWVLEIIIIGAAWTAIRRLVRVARALRSKQP